MAASSSGMLIQAAMTGLLPSLEKQISRGVDIDATDSDGRTALMAGAMNGHFDIVKFLVRKGHDLTSYENSRANVRLADRSGLTALHHAAASRSRELCDLLLRDSVIAQKNLRGETAADIARSMSDTELGTYLDSVNAADLLPLTPLSPRNPPLSPKAPPESNNSTKSEGQDPSAADSVAEAERSPSKSKFLPLRVFKKDSSRKVRESAPSGTLPTKEQLIEMNTSPDGITKKPSSAKLEGDKGKSPDAVPKKPSYIRNTNWTINAENSAATAEDPSPKTPTRSNSRAHRSQTAVEPGDKVVAQDALAAISTGRGSFVRPRTQSFASLTNGLCEEFLQNEVPKFSNSAPSTPLSPKTVPSETKESTKSRLSPRLMRAFEVHPSSRFRSVDLSTIKESAPVTFFEQFPQIAQVYPYLKDFTCSMRENVGPVSLRATHPGNMWICKYYLCFVGGSNPRKREIIYLPDVQSIAIQGKSVVLMRDELESTVENFFMNFNDPVESVAKDLKDFWKASLDWLKAETEAIATQSRSAIRDSVLSRRDLRLLEAPPALSPIPSTTELPIKAVHDPNIITPAPGPQGPLASSDPPVATITFISLSPSAPANSEPLSPSPSIPHSPQPISAPTSPSDSTQSPSASNMVASLDSPKKEGSRTRIKRDRSMRATIVVIPSSSNANLLLGLEAPELPAPEPKSSPISKASSTSSTSTSASASTSTSLSTSQTSSTSPSTKSKKSHSSSKERKADSKERKESKDGAEEKKKRSSSKHKSKSSSHVKKEGEEKARKSSGRSKSSHHSKSAKEKEPKPPSGEWESSPKSKSREHSSKSKSSKSSKSSSRRNRETIATTSAEVKESFAKERYAETPLELPTPPSLPSLPPTPQIPPVIPNSSQPTSTSVVPLPKPAEAEDEEERQVRLAREIQKAKATSALSPRPTPVPSPLPSAQTSLSEVPTATSATTSNTSSNGSNPSLPALVPVPTTPSAPLPAKSVDQIATELLKSSLQPPFTEWLALLADDFKYSIQNGPGLDKKRLVALFKSVFAAFPDFAYTVVSVTKESETSCIVKLNGSGTHSGVYALPGMPKLEPTNRKVTLDVETAYISTSPEGKVKAWRVELSSYMAGITGLFSAAGGRLGQK